MEHLIENLNSLREQSPLVHNITNYVVMNNTANALLSLGASPVMAHAENEVADIAAISSALVLNIGTLSDAWISAMITAGKKAKEIGIPIVLDPVGAGASYYRTNTCKQLIAACQPDVIRGNASEIMALGNSDIVTKGVDSTQTSNEALATANVLARELGCVIVISGETDYITDGETVLENAYGSPLMAKVTGMGCTASAIIGAFLGIEKNTILASLHAMICMGLAGEKAAKNAKGPGSFQMHFLDALYQLNEKDIQQLALPSL